MARREDLTGLVFGRLTVLTVAPSRGAETKWNCRCSCGKVLTVFTKALKRGMSRSCGCTKERHSASATPEYAAFRRMKNRCFNPKVPDFRLYGARGISVRFATFGEFLADIGPRPSPLHSVDRINSNGHYEPGNVRWATAREQANNMRVNRILTLGSESHSLAEWGRITGLSREVIEKRIDLLHWSIEDALMLPLRG